MASYTCTFILSSPAFTATANWAVSGGGPPTNNGMPLFQDGDTVTYAVATDGTVAYWDSVPASAITLALNFQTVSPADPLGGTALGPVSAKALTLANAELFTSAPQTLVGGPSAQRYLCTGQILAQGGPSWNAYRFALVPQPLQVGAQG